MSIRKDTTKTKRRKLLIFRMLPGVPKSPCTYGDKYTLLWQ